MADIDDLLAAAKRASGRTGSGTLGARTQAAKDMRRIQQQIRGNTGAKKKTATTAGNTRPRRKAIMDPGPGRSRTRRGPVMDPKPGRSRTRLARASVDSRFRPVSSGALVAPKLVAPKRAPLRPAKAVEMPNRFKPAKGATRRPAKVSASGIRPLTPAEVAALRKRQLGQSKLQKSKLTKAQQDRLRSQAKTMERTAKYALRQEMARRKGVAPKTLAESRDSVRRINRQMRTTTSRLSDRNRRGRNEALRKARMNRMKAARRAAAARMNTASTSRTRSRSRVTRPSLRRRRR